MSVNLSDHEITAALKRARTTDGVARVDFAHGGKKYHATLRLDGLADTKASERIKNMAAHLIRVCA